MVDFITLGIESSCDETSVAVIINGNKVASNIITSQLELHARFGGVVPEIAARCHLESILPVYRLALEHAGIDIEAVNLIAVTYGPGLVGCLLVGLSFAKGLALARKIPIIGVNHVEGHIYANILERPQIKPPLLCLTVSGGHTDLLFMEHWGKYRILGRTRDDAAGEAFDKVARVLGLPYPGGPAIDQIARGITGDLTFAQMKGLTNSYDFSFSGLKTAVINYLNRERQLNQEIDIPRIAASFQKMVVEQLVEKLIQAATDLQVDTILLSGGVAANTYLRARCLQEASRLGKQIYYPELSLCTDNAAMIGAAGYFRYLADGPADLTITAQPDLRL
ncbi:MAG TPA: tRNA (adenosine(37)-N6)-threonylcarbamoyltransferase complex transferase subunit TsaD [Bacillota bacterium]|nr:tRNA (adenosine(37)-N6)-threonylcarbamoyltransferase complex transferase subunit TsaD [Bacillota bacterium]